MILDHGVPRRREASLEAYLEVNASRRACNTKEQADRSNLTATRYNNLEVRDQLGWFYVSRNDLTNAIKEFQWILDKYNNDISGIIGFGAVYFSQGRYGDAEDKFREVLDLVPDEPIYHNNLAWALVRQGNRARPAGTFRSLTFGRQKERESQLDEAEKHSRKALKLDPSLSEALGCLGIIAFKRGNLRESEDYLSTSIEVDRKEGNYSDLGALYVQMGRYEEAEEKLKKAIEIDRNDTRAHIELGNLYLQTEKNKEALQELRQATAIDPNAEDPPRALAIALMQAGEFGEAERVLRNAFRRLDEAKRWQLHLTLSQVLTSLGDKVDDRQFYEEAIKEINRAILLSPKHPDPYFQAGIVRFKLDDYGKAYKNFRSCLKEDEYHYEADRNARRVRQLLRHSERIRRGGFLGSVVVGTIATTLVCILWGAYFFFSMSEVSETTLTVMTPTLLGLVVVAFLLPTLIRLKLPGGLEAELSQPKEPISSGPKGEIGFGSSPPTISSGPR
jgi:tetratricopeptide (TPR) repeat protein